MNIAAPPKAMCKLEGSGVDSGHIQKHSLLFRTGDNIDLRHTQLIALNTFFAEGGTVHIISMHTVCP